MKKLIVNNFGKIKHAEIELNKMMLFVGDNNSGKSYISSLIYGLYKLSDNDHSFDFMEIDKNDDLYNLVKDKFANYIFENLERPSIIPLNLKNDLKIIESSFNKFLNKNKEFIINNIFKYDVEIESLEIEIDKNEELEIEVLLYRNSVLYEDSTEDKITVFLRDERQAFGGTGFLTDVNDKEKFVEKFCDLFIRTIFKSILADNASYLPVSRTGFMLVHQDLVTNALKNRYDDIIHDYENMKKSELTKPTSDFLSTISSITRRKINNDLNNIIQYIESNVISGKINVSDTPTPVYTYLPNNIDKTLPMHVTSGVVTEITPLLLYLKYVKFDTMILEEPEICLHPKLQWSLIRALIKATHKNKNFILTTHSEAIVQHINDMIKLNRHPNRAELQKEFNYDDDDLISENNVNVYQFIVDEANKTSIEKIEYTDNGFVVSSFIDNLRARLKESIAFEDEE